MSPSVGTSAQTLMHTFPLSLAHFTIFSLSDTPTYTHVHAHTLTHTHNLLGDLTSDCEGNLQRDHPGEVEDLEADRVPSQALSREWFRDAPYQSHRCAPHNVQCAHCLDALLLVMLHDRRGYIVHGWVRIGQRSREHSHSGEVCHRGRWATYDYILAIRVLFCSQLIEYRLPIARLHEIELRYLSFPSGTKI
jgi:hypothetical protein